MSLTYDRTLNLTHRQTSLSQVVDTSKLISSPQDIFRSRRTACFLDQDQEINMVRNPGFPKKALLYRVFNERTFFAKDMIAEKEMFKSDRCIIKGNVNFASDRTFFVAAQTFMSFLLVLISMFEKSKSIWISDESLYEYSLVAYYSKRHPYNQQRYDSM